MMTEIRAAKILGSVRGMARVDRRVRCGDRRGWRAAIDDPDIAEIDINPLIVAGKRPIAVDAFGYSQARGEKVMAKKDLKRFFAPRSVAVIGASATKGRPGRVVIENMRANGYKGDIHPVNLRGGKLLGLKVYQNDQGSAEGIDLAIVILPAQATPQAVRDCAARNIGSIVLVAGGFAEVDHAGEDLQQELARASQETGVRVLGPNTAGHISTPADFTSSFFPLGEIPRGGISYVAQTGNFTGAMMKHIMSARKLWRRPLHWARQHSRHR